MTDAQRIDWLEAFVNREGAILLHDGAQRNLHEYSGIGLRPGGLSRELRRAIDTAAGVLQDVSALHGEEK